MTGWDYFGVKPATTRWLRAGMCICLLAALLAVPGRTGAQTQPDLMDVTPSTVFNYTANEIRLTGVDFEDPVVVSLGSEVLAEVTFVSSTEVTAVIPQGFPAGLYNVTITNPGGLSDTQPGGVEVHDPGPQPELLSVLPAQVVNNQPNTLTLTGSGFSGWSRVRLNDYEAGDVTTLGETEIRVVLPQNYPPGVYDVTVSNPGEYNSTLSGALIVQNPPPVVESVAPTEIPNDVDMPVVISGSGLAPGMSVYAGEVYLTPTWLDETQVQVTIPWGLDPGAYDLTLTNAGPGNPTLSLPDPITITQAFGSWSSDGPYGGIATIFVDPTDANRVFAAMNEAGVFRSVDGGENWEAAVRTNMMVLAFAPSNPEIIYTAGWGIKKSNDGGETWVDLNWPDWDYGDPTELLVHPDNPDIVYVAMRGNQFYSGGFFRSSDGGLTWEARHNGLTSQQFSAAVFHPDDPETIFAATFDGHLYQTSDGGLNWELAAQPAVSLTSLEIDPHGEHDLWAGRCPQDPAQVNGLIRASLSDLTDWESIPILEATNDCYPMNVTFDPTTAGTVYVTTHTNGYKTIDGGAGWTTDLTNFQVLQFALSGANPDIVYASHWGKGVKKSLDGGFTWTEINQGLAGVIPWAIAAVPGNPDEVYVCSNPYGLYWSNVGGHAWVSRAELRGCVGAAGDPFVPGRAYITNFLGIAVSPDHGQTWSDVVFQNVSTEWCEPNCRGVAGGYSIAMDPATPGRLIVSAGFNFDPALIQYTPGQFFISEDYGLTWRAVPPASSRQGAADVIVFSPSNPQIVYASGANGTLRSEDAGESWEEITPPGLEEYRLSSLVVSPQDEDIILLSANHDTLGGVWRSMDRGETWERVYENLGVLHFANSTPPVLYLGGSGLFRSYDLGETFSRASGSLGQVPIKLITSGSDSERFVLYVATAGGFWSAGRIQTGEGLDAGIYRQTEIVPDEFLYLPLLTR